MRRFVLGCALIVAAAACTGGTTLTSASRPGVTEAAISTGGTLRVALLFDPAQQLDPQKEYDGRVWELFRCCLLRTLFSYNGMSTQEGGARPRPDLAVGPPDISPDGLTWTFHIRAGIHYAPPFEDTEIISGDFVSAMKRTLRVRVEGENIPGTFGTTAFYYIDVIAGAREYADGASDTISGLETPDDHTLVVHLTRPTGDLDYRFAMPTTAPIPPSPTDLGAPFGAANGHDDGYGPFLVASGPYMLEGSGALDFNLPPPDQEPVAGYAPGTSITFVRNPSWQPGTDSLRAAYADRMELAVDEAASENDHMLEELAGGIDTGEIDLVLDGNEASETQLDRYKADPALRGRIHSTSSGSVFYLAMNLATPPFDDIHVRRAVNLVIDKAALLRWIEAFPGPATADIATHIAPDTEEGELLSSWDPYPTPNHSGDVKLARNQIARSRYDSDSNGVCDAAPCRNVSSAGLACWAGLTSTSEPGAIIRSDLSQIGIRLAKDPRGCDALHIFDPTAHLPVTPSQWGVDFPDASNFLQQLFSFTGVGTKAADYPDRYLTMIGASPSQLRGWGYLVDHVPNIDDRIERCVGLTFEPRITCWAELDRFLMTQVVPWAPLLDRTTTWIVSPRVSAFSIDQSFGLPALDRIALTGGTS